MFVSCYLGSRGYMLSPYLGCLVLSPVRYLSQLLSALNTFIKHVQETFGHLFPSRVDCNPLPSKLGMSMVLHEHCEV